MIWCVEMEPGWCWKVLPNARQCPRYPIREWTNLEKKCWKRKKRGRGRKNQLLLRGIFVITVRRVALRRWTESRLGDMIWSIRFYLLWVQVVMLASALSTLSIETWRLANVNNTCGSKSKCETWIKQPWLIVPWDSDDNSDQMINAFFIGFSKPFSTLLILSRSRIPV